MVTEYKMKIGYHNLIKKTDMLPAALPTNGCKSSGLADEADARQKNDIIKKRRYLI